MKIITIVATLCFSFSTMASPQTLTVKNSCESIFTPIYSPSSQSKSFFNKPSLFKFFFKKERIRNRILSKFNSVMNIEEDSKLNSVQDLNEILDKNDFTLDERKEIEDELVQIYMNFIDKLAIQGATSNLVKKNKILLSFFKNSMTVDLRTKLLNRIVSQYRTASKKPPHSFEQNDLGPKRSLDALFTALMDSDINLINEIHEGLDPWLAYKKYFKKVRHYFDVAPGEIPYSSEDVQTVITSIQKSLKTIQKNGLYKIEKPLPIDFHLTKENSVILGGTFPTGRANPLTSDIDTIVSAPDIDRDLHFRGSFGMKDDMEVEEPIDFKIQSFIGNLNTGLRPELENLKFECAWKGFSNHEEHERFFLFLSPLTIKITSDRVELHVLDQQGNFHSFQMSIPETPN